MVGIVHQVSWLATSPDPLLQSVTMEAAHRNQSMSQIKSMLTGALGYENVKRALPPGATMDSNGRLLHGWQAQLLPYFEGTTLHEQIDFERPWDHAANRHVFQTEIELYRNPRAQTTNQPAKDAIGYSLSDYAANVHVMGPQPPLRTNQISDGAAKTILMGEASENRKPWGYPANWRDPARGINATPDGFGASWVSGGANFGFADGHVEFISEDIDPEVLKALSTPKSSESLDDRN
jgi:prepilin-type processing-associated H-X9-DG protein